VAHTSHQDALRKYPSYEDGDVSWDSSHYVALIPRERGFVDDLFRARALNSAALVGRALGAERVAGGAGGGETAGGASGYGSAAPLAAASANRTPRLTASR
jgi:hypothetical protein